MPNKLKAEGGAIPLLMLLIAVGLIAFLLVSSTFNFKDRLFSTLYNKVPSLASNGGWKNYDDAVKEGKIKPAGKILMVSMHYDENASPKITIVGITKLNGYVPLERENKGYKIQLLDSNKKVLHSRYFNPPNLLLSEYLTKEGTMSGKFIEKNNFDFSITIPAVNTATDVEIADSKLSRISMSTLKNSKVIDNKPNFQVTTGADILENDKANKQSFNLNSLLKLIRPNDTLAQTNNLNGVLDITFIGNNYSSTDYQSGGKFDQDVKRMTDQMKVTEPFKGRFNQLHFSKVLNTTDLKCVYPIVCDANLSRTAVASSGAPQEIETVIDNNQSQYGGATDISCDSLCKVAASGFFILNVSYITNAPSINNALAEELTFLHESGGHALAKLYDEYTYYSTSPYAHFWFDKNCYSGTPPSQDPIWDQNVATFSYFSGCSNPSAWRSSNTSIMYSSYIDAPVYGGDRFNLVSQVYINQAMDIYVNGGTSGGGGTGTGGIGSLLGTSCSDPIKPNNCTCYYNRDCNSGYCATDHSPKVCVDAPPGYGVGENVCTYTNFTVNVSSIYRNPLPVSSVAPETTPPTTTVTAGNNVGADPNQGYAGVFINSAIENLACIDNSGGSGCDLAYTSPIFCIDSSNSCTPNIVSNRAFYSSASDVKKYLRYNSTDIQGNVEQIKSVPLIIDNTPPAVTITAPDRDGFSTNPGVTLGLKMNFSDISDIKSVEVWWDNASMCHKTNLLASQTYTSCSIAIPLNTSGGTHTIKVTTYDNANLSTDSYRYVSVVVIPPNPTLSLTRYVKGSERWVSTSYQNSPLNYGYTVDLALSQPQLGYVYSSNGGVPAYPTLFPPSIRLYDCTAGSDHVTNSSMLGNCSGKTNILTIGWIYSYQRTGTVPLYWCESGSNHDNTAALQSNCGSSTNINHGILGYVDTSP